jgi:hypothetical protein
MRTQNSEIIFEHPVDFPAVPDMVACCDDVNSSIEEFLCIDRQQSVPGRRIFPVANNKVGTREFSDAPKSVCNKVGSGGAHNVSDT